MRGDKTAEACLPRKRSLKDHNNNAVEPRDRELGNIPYPLWLNASVCVFFYTYGDLNHVYVLPALIVSK